MIIQPLAQPDCAQDDGTWCARLYRLTGSDLVARYSDAVIGAGLQILLILVLAVLTRLLLHRTINRLSRATAQGGHPGALRPQRDRDESRGAPRTPSRTERRRAARAQAIGSVLRSVSTGVVYGVTITLVLSELGINLLPILASAGIAGVALGFGAQNLVKDFLSGMFMLIEDQYGVGDWVDLGEASGTVEEVGIRVTTLRDLSGTVWYVRNGEVMRAGNFSQDYSVAIVDVLIGHGANITAATELAERTAAELTGTGGALASTVLEPPQMLGVQAIGPEGVTLRLTARVRPGQQWELQRALLAGIQNAFTEAGIPPPAPARWTAPPP